MGMVRPNNEDNVQLWCFDKFLVGMVADGMGGAAGGEFASRLAVDSIQDQFVEAYPDTAAWAAASEDEIARKMAQALVGANQAVLDKASQDHALHGMGTTTTMVIVRGLRAMFAHIGDSRAYWVQKSSGQIQQVTKDHSFVQALVDSGHLTPEQAEVHPIRHVLYRALGQKPEKEVEIDLDSRGVQAGDRLILCSDGLPRHVQPEEICALSLRSDEPAQIGQSLINLAKERGGEDNVSVVVIIWQNL
jgi:protein phosphatase